MTEAEIEKAIVDYAKSRGALAEKVVLHSGRGFPDRTIIAPDGRIGFLEIKKPGGIVSPAQKTWLRRLERLGHRCGVAFSVEDGKKFIERILER